MTLRTALLATAFVAMSGVASAGPINGWYVGLEGGAVWLEDWSHRFNVSTPAQASFDTGWAVLGTVGHGWNGWRVELEAGYRDNDADAYQFPPAVPFNINASLWEASFMANVLYDVGLINNLSLSLGVGAGGDFTNGEFTAGATKFETDNWNFAYQGIAGLNYAIGRQTTLFLDYRYMRVVDAEFDFRPSTSILLNDADDIVKHTATIGIRYALYSPAVMSDVAPPPPPEPAGPQAAPRQFIVFFGFNKYNLTSEALRVISEAVTAAKETGSARVLITGHTDTVGSNGYNMRLSMRRSNAVKAEMVRQGVSNSSITTSGKGESELLVQTADGVKEPQNRRATIDLN